MDVRVRAELEARGIELQTHFWEVPTLEAAHIDIPTVEVAEEVDEAPDGGNDGDQRFDQAFQASLRMAYVEDEY